MLLDHQDCHFPLAHPGCPHDASAPGDRIVPGTGFFFLSQRDWPRRSSFPGHWSMKDIICQVLESTHLMLNNPGACMLSRCSHIQLCDPHGLEPARLHGILQAIILEWVAMASSRGSSWPRDLPDPCLWHLLHWQAGSLPLAPPGKPKQCSYCPNTVLCLYLTRNVYIGHIQACLAVGVQKVEEKTGPILRSQRYPSWMPLCQSQPLKWAKARLDLFLSVLVNFNSLILYFSQTPGFPSRLGMS